MLRCHKFLSLCFLLVVLPTRAALPDAVQKQLAAAGLPTDAMAVVVRRISDGKTVISHQPDRPMAPASTMKLVTTLVGIERLGPTYRAKTELLATAKPQGGVLAGDLYLRGGGDGDLDWEAFFHMLQDLRQKGVAEIRGDLIVDRTRFNPARLDIGVPPFDESPEFRYNVIPDALLLNTNLLRLDLDSDANSLAVRMTPQLDRVTVSVDMMLIDGPCPRWESGWKLPQTEYAADGSARIHLTGTFPRNCSANTQISVIDRARYADLLFRQLWQYLGGRFTGSVKESAKESAQEGATPKGASVLADHQARPLADMLRAINKPSDNPLARTLFLTLGTLDNQGEGTTLARAEREVRAWFKGHSIDDTGLVLENGSGLSRSERIKPEQMVGLLAAAWKSNWAPEFLSSMPIGGLDGTLRRRMGSNAAAQRARLKTGTLRNVNALAGFVPDADGDMCIVVAIVNQDPGTESSISKRALPVLDDFIDSVSHMHTGQMAQVAPVQ